MPVTPSTIYLSYKKLSVNYAEADIYIDYGYVPSKATIMGVTFTNKPAWLNTVRVTNEHYRLVVKSEANSLPLGQHSEFMSVRLDYRLEVTDPNTAGSASGGSFLVNLTVTDTVALTLTPNILNYNYTLGDAAPGTQTINVASESAWTATNTKTWVTLTNALGVANGAFLIDVTPSGLAVGTHTDIITVVDGLFTKTLNLSLVISEADTGVNFLFANPATLEFNYTVGGYSAIKVAEYNASGNWTVTADKTWVQLSVAGGTAGVGVVEVSLHNTFGLTEGVEHAEITFSQGGLVKKIYVTLNVYQLIESILNPNTLYFADDENYIEVSSLRENTYLSLDLNSNFEGNVYVGNYAIPFNRASGKRRIGAFPKKIISHRALPSNLNVPGLYIPYLTALINITVKEEEITSDQISQVVNANNIQFLKGTTPPSVWLSDMPTHRYLTKKGLLSFGFLSNGLIPSSIEVSGDASATFGFSNPLNEFYACHLPMEVIEGLTVGNDLTILVGTHTQTVTIVDEGEDHCIILWENQWGIYDSFECTGEIQDTNNYTNASEDFVISHLKKETKVLAAETNAAIKINTGWIYSPEEIVGLSKMLKALNVYILRGDTAIKVKPTTKSLQLYQTNDTEPAFNLTFENVLIL